MALTLKLSTTKGPIFKTLVHAFGSMDETTQLAMHKVSPIYWQTQTSNVHLQIEEGIKKRFETTIIKQYGVDVTRNSTNKLITDAWDSMQRSVCNSIVIK